MQSVFILVFKNVLSRARVPSIFKLKNGHFGSGLLSPKHRKPSLQHRVVDSYRRTQKQEKHDMINALLYSLPLFLLNFLQAATEKLFGLEEMSVFLNAGVYKAVRLPIILPFTYSTNDKRQTTVSVFGYKLPSWNT